MKNILYNFCFVYCLFYYLIKRQIFLRNDIYKYINVFHIFNHLVLFIACFYLKTLSHNFSHWLLFYNLKRDSYIAVLIMFVLFWNFSYWSQQSWQAACKNWSILQISFKLRPNALCLTCGVLFFSSEFILKNNGRPLLWFVASLKFLIWWDKIDAGYVQKYSDADGHWFPSGQRHIP